MGRFLFAPWLFAGHWLPQLAIAQEVRARGHEVFFYAEDAAAKLARAAGCVHVPTPPDGTGAALPRIKTTRQLTALMVRQAELLTPHLVRTLEQLRIDVSVVDALSPGLGAAMERHGQPWATLFPSPAPLAREARDAAQSQLPLGALRKRLGLPATARNSLTQNISPDLVLLPWYPGMVPAARLPHAHAVGPLNWEPPPSGAPRWIQPLGKRRPLVLVGMSSLPFGSDPEAVNHYVSESIAALNVMDVDAVVTLGSGSYTLQQAPAKHVRLEQFVPHNFLLARASAMVTHGGWGTIGRSLARGVPLVIVPFGLDHPQNAAVCEKLGVARSISLDAVSAEWICDSLHRLLKEKSRESRQAARAQARIAPLRPAVSAAERVISLLRQKK